METGFLAGKCGVVTGGGQGIGAAICKELARLGAAVVVNDLGAGLRGQADGVDSAGELAAAILASGGRAVANRASVADFAGAQSMIDDCLQAFGRVDFVIHNAGIVRDVIFHKMSEDDFDRVIAVHLKGCFNICRAAAPVFRQQAGGSIIAMTSTSGLIGNIGQSNYAAAKLGIVGLIKGIALDLQRFGVRANAISPFAWTRMTASIPAGDEARLQRLQKLDPAQVAPLAALLCSDASREITGQVFAVRGSEIVLFEPFRPARSLHRQGGWSAQDLAETLPAAFKSSFAPLHVTADVFGYDPLL